MIYTPATGYALMVVAVLCVFTGAPPWMFLATGLAAVVFGIVGLRQGRAAKDGDERSDDVQI